MWLFLALFGHTSARLNNTDGIEHDQRALGNDNDNNGNGNGNGNNGKGNENGGGAGVISNPDDAGEPSQFDLSRPLVTPPLLELPLDTSPPLVSYFAAGNAIDASESLADFGR